MSRLSESSQFPPGTDSNVAPDPGLQEAKRALRKEVLAARGALDSQSRQRLSGKITEQLLALPEYRAAAVVAAYASFGSEFDTSPFLKAALASGKRLLLPRVDLSRRRMQFCAVSGLASDLVPGVWGIPEPALHCLPVAASGADFVLVPGVAVSVRGARLGYGGGFYDRLLAENGVVALRVLAAFSMQTVAQVPTGPWDLPVDVVVTETSVIRIAS